MADHRLGFESFDEETDPVELDVAGELPEWLSGTLYRNGPGDFEVGDRDLTHWFDGFALLRRFRFDDGIEYSSRFLESDAYRAAREGELRYPEFGTNPDWSFLGRLRGLLGGARTDNASLTVRHRDGEHRAVTETAREVAFDPVDLSTLGTHDGSVEGTGTLAHDHYDFHQEEWVGLGIDYGRDSGYVLYHDPDDGPAETVAHVERDEPAYMHSFALTDHYAVLTEHPFTTSPRRLLDSRPFAESFRWYPERDTRFLVVDRREGEVVAEPTVPPFFTFHHVDAFERGDELFVDLVAFEDHSVVESLSLANLRSRAPEVPDGELRRYRIDLEAGEAEGRTLFEEDIEFPTTNYAEANLHPYRFCYGVGSEAGSFNDRLHKVDVEHGTNEEWREAELHPGEPLFVPRPDAEEEDDGVLISVALDVEEERSCVLVLDAAGFEEIARAYLPHALPFDFHGTFYADGEEPTPSMT
ncbi:carotenoid oxygenase family protein [Halalkalicoccus tibetensis]|uniref:Carotenoid oxygenase family protein n=1 Tax=Halalkalicoccus tibetensis TaxID=175632 RepID=A0ABD5V5E8_9EURY